MALISVIGICKDKSTHQNTVINLASDSSMTQRFDSQKHDRAFGFTLIEILIVMVLIGTVAAMILPSFSSEAKLNKELKIEAKRLYLLLSMAADEAQFNSLDIGVLVLENRYSFHQFDYEKEDWIAMPDLVFEERNLPEDIRLTLAIDGDAIQLVGKAESTDEKQDELIKPDLFFLSSGEVTPFSLTIEFNIDDAVASFVIESNGIEEIRLNESS